MKVSTVVSVRQVYGKGRKALARVHGARQKVSKSRAWLGRLCGAMLTCVMLFGGGVCQADEDSPGGGYQLGQGYRLGDSGLTLGGYSTVSAEKLRDEPTRTALDDLSLFVWWDSEGRWKFFSELDYENVLAHPSRRHDGEGIYLALERLYFDYAWSDALNFRIGKFLTPIGRWNLIHATPLVWTTSRPLITGQTFPTNVTGLMVTGTLSVLDRGIDYAVYASNGREIRPNPAIDPFYEVIGGHLGASLSVESQLGVSLATYEQKQNRDERKRLVGLDYVWSRQRYEISAEGVYRFSDNGNRWDEKGAFLQAVAPLSEKLYAVGRYELFRRAGQAEVTQLWVGGLNYRIDRAIVLKAEWIGSKHNTINAPQGLMSSLSVLF